MKTLQLQFVFAGFVMSLLSLSSPTLAAPLILTSGMGDPVLQSGQNPLISPPTGIVAGRAGN